jgi:hypothetical protein
VDNPASPLPAPARAIEIAPDYEPGGEEALVTAISRGADGLRVSLVSADGSALETRLSAARAEQLELRTGAIVSVRASTAEAA